MRAHSWCATNVPPRRFSVKYSSPCTPLSMTLRRFSSSANSVLPITRSVSFAACRPSRSCLFPYPSPFLQNRQLPLLCLAWHSSHLGPATGLRDVKTADSYLPFLGHLLQFVHQCHSSCFQRLRNAVVPSNPSREIAIVTFHPPPRLPTTLTIPSKRSDLQQRLDVLVGDLLADGARQVYRPE